MALRSKLAENAREPHGDTQTAFTGPLCAAMSRSSLPVATSHARTLESSLAETSVSPDGVNASARTPSECGPRESVQALGGSLFRQSSARARALCGSRFHAELTHLPLHIVAVGGVEETRHIANGRGRAACSDRGNEPVEARQEEVGCRWGREGVEALPREEALAFEPAADVVWRRGNMVGDEGEEALVRGPPALSVLQPQHAVVALKIVQTDEAGTLVQLELRRARFEGGGATFET
eukprot:6200150-Pleurochrysis_carterae.AAC.3